MDSRKLPESLPSGLDAYGQSLEALLTQPAASESESHVPDAVSEMRYSAVCSGALAFCAWEMGSVVHSHDQEWVVVPDKSPDSSYRCRAKPLGKHRASPPPSHCL
ncbi:hypothetical protein Tco_1082725 [Tanacetum coccineum]|uniref:Uncharacterized protein n=1 Tax=Tanacetum coccineum TaxID=301880 RepID=A0ABQ5I1B9_9ASTR